MELHLNEEEEEENDSPNNYDDESGIEIEDFNIANDSNQEEIQDEELQKELDIDPDEWEPLEPNNYQNSLFSAIPESKIKVENLVKQDPFLLYQEIFSDDFFQMVANETNAYYEQTNKASKRDKRWENVDYAEIKAFFGVILLLMINKTTSIKDHWSNNKFLQSPLASVISQNKFDLIWKYLHFHDNANENEKEKIFKIKHVIDYCNLHWKRLYQPGQNLSIDESMIGFQGQTKFLQYEPRKPVKIGIKAWALAEAKTGYMLGFELYEGKSTFKKLTLSEDVVIRMCKGYEHKNHIIYFDSFYTTPYLCMYLKQQGFGCVGMVQSNRKGLDRSFKNIKSEKGNSLYFENKDLIYLTWKDKKQISLLSTLKESNSVATRTFNKITKQYDEIMKPTLMISYTVNMRGVDRNNQMSSNYMFEYRSFKWWKPVLFRLINISIVNLYLIHRNFSNSDPHSHKTFILDVIDKSLKCYKWIRVRPKEMESISNIMLKKYPKNKRRRCKPCYNIRKRTDTYFYCDLCYMKTNKYYTVCLECLREHTELHK